MDKMIIEGGIPLIGEVEVSGSKNASLPIIASSIMFDDAGNEIFNVPDLEDIKTIKKLLISLGAEIKESGETGKVIINTSNINNYEAPYDLVKTMRASVLVLGPLLAKYKRARVSLPGGCAIGARPIDFHLNALKLLGANIVVDHGYVEAFAERLRGATINFPIPSVTGTENVVMAASLAEGTTVINNAAREPEIDDLILALNNGGADIKRTEPSVIVVNGVKKLNKLSHRVLPDRIEAGTFMVASAITRGDITIKEINVSHLKAVIDKLSEAGAKIVINSPSSLRIKGSKVIKSVDISTAPYPDFPTDMQAQMMALMTISSGLCVISENVFENRFMHVAELMRLGANVKVRNNFAIVKGVEKLSGAEVMATDLRASASLVLAGLASSDGYTAVSRIYHLDRGYEKMEKKLANLGAIISRVSEAESSNINEFAEKDINYGKNM
ncbi:MAG: UDP-N-acetylglucosamine 1-carboxyvinyltransferase [Deltaproteobacteria bacterium]|jgi:UDP-N-acetylglucosamine 1-carboxyvinyltransferase|nr:UDP-N-acetylglucosamine 1-carboxyvinyltransferase [Deltaproteobacteria bacterium]MCL5879865.1 UDP-N-acetylglucosamine 1-carboxyvinyltransferase [Deltaproteobacteria bacterium]MDA8303852.1 UDP-N-acetylglucosamine 1-carboxyvinyltransferase [Deltaproteobacteria bacterium]